MDARARTVSVPLEDLDQIVERDARGVVLTRFEYEKLLALVQKQAEASPPSSQPIVASTAEYSAEIAGDQLVLTALLEFTQLRPGWQTLALPFRNVAIERAMLDDQPARLGRSGPDGHAILFSTQQGRHRLSLKLATPLARQGSDRNAAFALPPVPAGRIEVSLPPGEHLHLDNLPLDRPRPSDQPAKYMLAIGGRSALNLRIGSQRAMEQAASLVFASSAVELAVAAEERTWRATTRLNVFGKPIDALPCVIPKSLEIVAIDSPGLDRWEIAAGPTDDTSTLHLVYRQPVADVRTIQFQGVSNGGLGEPWSVPTLGLSGVASHLVHIVVGHATGLRLQSVAATLVRQVAEADTGEQASVTPDKPGADDRVEPLHYDAWQENFTLRFVTRPRSRELQATIATRVDVNTDEISLQSSLAIRTRFAPLFDLDVAFPVDWSVGDVLMNGKPALWRVVPVDASSNQIRISFQPPIPTDGKALLTLSARRVPEESGPIGQQPFECPLPELHLPQVAVTDGRYMLAAEAGLELTVTELNGLDPVPLSREEQRLPRAPRFAYEYQDTRFEGKVRAERLPPRVSARTLAFHRLERESLVSYLESRLRIQGGSLEAVDLFLPESAGSDLRFRVIPMGKRPAAAYPIIVEQSTAPADGGERLWRLRFDRRVDGQLWLAVDLQTPRAADAKEFPLPILRIGGSDQQTAQVALEAASDQQLKALAVDARGQTLAEVDPPDLLAPAEYLPRERIVAAFQAVRPGYRIVVSESRFERQPVPSAICDAASLATVVGETGELQHQAEFVLRATGVQSLRIELPAEGRLWSTLLDGEPVEVRIAPGAEGALPAYLVPFAPVADPVAERHLTLIYSTPAGRLQESGTLRQTPARLTVVSGEGTTQPLEILEREWILVPPEETEVATSRGAFEPIEPLAHASLLGSLNENLRLGGGADLPFKGMAILMCAAVIGTLWLSFRRRGAHGVALTVILGGTFLTLLALAQPAVYQAREAARRSQAQSDLMQGGVATSQFNDLSIATEGGGGLGGAIDAAEATKRDSVIAELSRHNKLQSNRRRFGQIAGLLPGSRPDDLEQLPFQQAQRKKNGEADSFSENVNGRLERGQNRDHLVAFDGLAELALDDKQPPDAVGNGAVGNIVPPDGNADPEAPVQAALNRVSDAKRKGSARTSGLLSLRIDLPGDSNSRPVVFRYAGTPAASVEPELLVELRGRRGVSILWLIWQSGVLLGFWFSRGWSAGVRVTLAVAGILVPLALAPLVPRETLPHLDGLFLGTVWGLLLWGILALVGRRHAFGASRRLPKSLTTAATACAAISMAFLAAASVGAAGDDSARKRADSPFYVERQSDRHVAWNDAPPQVTPHSALGTPHSSPSTLILPTTAANPLDANRVFLPFDRFLELWRAAHPELEIEREAPRDGVVAEALYTAEVAAGGTGTKPSVAITGRFVVHSFRNEQVSLPLPLGRISLRTASLNGKTAPIVSREGDDGPELTIVLPERGTHVVDVHFSLPLESSGPGGRFSLPLRAVPAGSLQFTFPAPDLALQVTGSSAAFRRITEGSGPLAIVPVDRGGEITLAWTTARAQTETEGIVHTESSTSLAFDDSGLRLRAQFRYNVRLGSMSEARFALAPTLLVRRIAGPDLGGWETIGEGNERTLRIFLQRPVNDTTFLDFDLFQPAAIAEQPHSFSVPQLAPLGIARETGLIGIFAAEQLSIAPGAHSGLTQIDASQFVSLHREEASASRGSPPAIMPHRAYRFTSRPFQLSLSAARLQSTAKGTAEHACHIGYRKLRLASRLEVQIAGAPRSELSIQLPAGYVLYDLRSPAVADYFVEPAADGQPSLLHVELSTPRAGTVELRLNGVIPRAAEDMLPLVAAPFPLGLGELRSTLAVWLDRSFSATFEDLEGWKSIDPVQLPGRLRAARKEPAQLAFSSSQTAVNPIILDLTRATPRLAGDALSVVMVHDTIVHFALSLRWRITLAGEETFVFTTPDWLADRLVFDRNLPGVRLRQVTSEKIDGNRLRWTVSLDAPRETSLLLTAQAATPLPENGKIIAPFVQFERVQLADDGKTYTPLDSQLQQVVLVNQSSQRVEREAAEGSVDAISSDDLAIRIGSEISHRAAEVLAVKNMTSPLAWQLQPAATLKSLPASVNLARLTTVISTDGSWRAEANYQIQNRARQFLAVRLPAGARVLSLFVGGQPARPIRPDRPNDPEVRLLPLPKTAVGDLAADVRLNFAGQLDRPLPQGVQVLRSEVDLPVPQVLSQNEDPDFGAPVAATEWTVILPKDIDAARVDDPGRSNVAASIEGAEQIIAKCREMLGLINVAAVARSQNNRRQLERAQNNLKQLGGILQQNEAQRVRAAPDGGRQTRQLSELESRLQSAQQELAALGVSASPATGEALQDKGIVTPSELTREIISSNPIDFSSNGQVADGESFFLDFDAGKGSAPTPSTTSSKSSRPQKSSTNRAELKSETAAQSVVLNNLVDGRIGARDDLSSNTPSSDQPSAAPLEDQDADGASTSREKESDGKVPLEDDGSEDGVLPFRTGPARNSARQNARRGGAIAGVPILAKPTFLGELFARQQDFVHLGRADAKDAEVDKPQGEGARAWSQPGGLSLEIQLPQAGQKLTFSKPGGDARLALGLRPHASREAGFGLAWTFVWIPLALGLIAVLGRADAKYVLRQWAPVLLAVVGLLWYLVLTPSLPGLVLFTVGLAGWAWQHRRSAA